MGWRNFLEVTVLPDMLDDQILGTKAEQVVLLMVVYRRGLMFAGLNLKLRTIPKTERSNSRRHQLASESSTNLYKSKNSHLLPERAFFIWKPLNAISIFT